MSTQTEKLFEVEIAEIRKDFEYLSKQLSTFSEGLSKRLDELADKLSLLNSGIIGQQDLQRQINQNKDSQDKKHDEIMEVLREIKGVPTDMALVKKFIKDQETLNEKNDNFVLQTKVIVGAIALTTTILTVISAAWGSIKDLAR